MFQTIEFRELLGTQKLCAITQFHRDTGQDRSFAKSLWAFHKVLRSTSLLWDAETGEPSLDTGNFPQKG